MNENIIERVVALAPQSQGLGLAEIMALSKREGGGFGEGGGSRAAALAALRG